MGADLVVHSTTKYLTGNGTVTGGAVVDSGRFDWTAAGKFPSLTEPEPAYHGLRFHETFGPMAYTFFGIAIGLRDLGMTMAPQSAFYTLLGIETLSLRMKKHVENAEAVAAWRAATVGEMIPGRSATRNFRRWVTGISEAATSQESSQERPVGISTPPKPRRSAAWAICCR